MQKIRVSPISFLNTLPLIYGIKHSNVLQDIEITIDTPAQCASKLIEGLVDVGLVPVASIPYIANAQVITNYCIGVSGAVRTVVLVSEVPLVEINEIVLDYQSLTSVMLAKILAKEFWKISVVFSEGNYNFEKDCVKGNTAAIVIGDKVFGIENKYSYVYDLALEWRNFTGMSFVFACWVANCKLPEGFIEKFNSALCIGVNNIENALKTSNNLLIPYSEAVKYLSDNIDYNLTIDKREAMELFLKKANHWV